MKWLLLFLMIFICVGCGNQASVGTEYYGIDVSGSALNNLDKNLTLIKEKMLEGSAEKINIFIFANESYEVYDGIKPSKDRQVEEILKQAILKSKSIKWKPGTSFDNVLDYLNKRINNASDLYIYTDGFFELKKYNDVKEQSIVSKMHNLGLKNAKFFGINITNKDTIYNMFKLTSVKVDLN